MRISRIPLIEKVIRGIMREVLPWKALTSKKEKER